MSTKYKRAHPSRWPGVYCYESLDRIYQDGSDLCFVISYKLEDKKRWEKVGWKSEGYSAQVAAEVRAERVKAARHGKDVQTAKEIQRERSKTNRSLDDLATAYFGLREKSRQISASF